MFTASVAFVPAATLVTCLLPALMPCVVTLGPPAITKPVLFKTTALLEIAMPALFRTVSPALIESTVKSLAVET